MSVSRSLRLYPNSEFKTGADVFLARTGPRQEHGGRGRLRAANALQVVVGHFGGPPRLGQHFIERIAGDADRAHPHRRTIAPALVGLAPARCRAQSMKLPP